MGGLMLNWGGCEGLVLDRMARLVGVEGGVLALCSFGSICIAWGFIHVCIA